MSSSFRLSYLLVCTIALAALLSACGRSGPAYSASLSAKELAAVDRFERDRWTDVIAVYRTSADVLRVRTRQGNEEIDYQVTFPAEGAPEYQRLPIVTFGQ